MSGRDKTSCRKSLFKRYPILKVELVVVAILVIVSENVGFAVHRASEVNEKVLAPIGSGVEIPVRPSLAGKKIVALTFDDGPSAETTPRLLDILKKNGVCVTFFTLGRLAERNSDIIQREKNECHEVATHTISHSQLTKMSANEIREEVSDSEEILQSITGEIPSLMRPPYGAVNDMVKETSNLPLILWSVDTLDWKYRNTESIVEYTMNQIADGGIILMHDIHETSVDAVETLILTLREEGYEFATISELASLKGVDLEAGEVYYHF